MEYFFSKQWVTLPARGAFLWGNKCAFPLPFSSLAFLSGGAERGGGTGRGGVSCRQGNGSPLGEVGGCSERGWKGTRWGPANWQPCARMWTSIQEPGPGPNTEGKKKKNKYKKKKTLRELDVILRALLWAHVFKTKRKQNNVQPQRNSCVYSTSSVMLFYFSKLDFWIFDPRMNRLKYLEPTRNVGLDKKKKKKQGTQSIEWGNKKGQLDEGKLLGGQTDRREESGREEGYEQGWTWRRYLKYVNLRPSLFICVENVIFIKLCSLFSKTMADITVCVCGRARVWACARVCVCIVCDSPFKHALIVALF